MKVARSHLDRIEAPARPGWVVFPKYVAGAAAMLSPRPRAGTLLELGRTDDALAAAQEAVAAPAEDVRSEVVSLRVLGTALRASGDPDGGRKALEQALEAARSTGQTSEVATTEALLTAG
jgi:hypothetical protein